MMKKILWVGAVLLFLNLSAKGQWSSSAKTLDASGSVGTHTSMASIQGKPAISYFDQTNFSLKFVRSDHPTGGSWKTPITIDNTGYSGYYTSLAEINGKPAISYYDAQAKVLKFVIANDIFGNTWSSPVIVDSSGIVGWYTSLVEFQGKPAISYYDVTNGDLKFIWANDANGNTWNASVVLDSFGNVGLFNSMISKDDFIAISYYDESLSSLKYQYGVYGTSLNWHSSVFVDSVGDPGKYSSIQIVESRPAISYYDQQSASLKYIRSEDSLGLTWPINPIVLDADGDVGKYSCLSSIGDKPIISYFDATNQNLKYLRAMDIKGKVWAATPIIIDNSSSVGEYSSMIIVNNHPMISYFDAANQDLKFIYGGAQFAANQLSFGLTATDLNAESPERNGYFNDNTQTDISVFPNPTTDYIYFENTINAKVQILSINGQLLRNEEINNENFIDLRDIESGTYILRFILESNEIISKKIIRS